MATEDWLRDHHCRTGIIFTAFAIEAMFIFYRKQVDPDYDKKQKETRKAMHKNTLRLCGINNYMGTKQYQMIQECLEARDAIAHGDSYISGFHFSTDHFDNQENIVRSILAVNSEQFRGLTIEHLDKYIEMAKHIDYEISDKGYMTSESGLPADERSTLMLAFGVSGVSQWPSA